LKVAALYYQLYCRQDIGNHKKWLSHYPRKFFSCRQDGTMKPCWGGGDPVAGKDQIIPKIRETYARVSAMEKWLSVAGDGAAMIVM
jgi:hypothetical protein